jgi:tetratricopeptide (TPR) repeat protein
MIKKTLRLSVSGVLLLLSLNASSQSWRGNYQKLLKNGKDVSALQYLWLNTERGTKGVEHMERAKLLDVVGFPILSIREWTDAARAAPGNTAVLQGFGEAALKWDRLGSVSSLVKAIGSDNANSWPAAFKIAVALHAYRSGNSSLALRLLPNASELRTIRDLEARRLAGLHLASMQWGVGQPSSAIETLQLVMGNDASASMGTLRLQAARLYYDMGRMTDSLEQLLRLPRNSGSWYPGVLVGAWAAYRLKDYNLALGQLLTLHSPYLNNKFAPETYILEAATLFQLCQFNSAQKSLSRLREKYKSVVAASQAFARSYSDSASRVTAVLNYARGKKDVPFGANEEAFALVMDALIQEDVLARSDRLLLQHDFELANLDRILPSTDQVILRNLKNRYQSELRYARIEAYRNGVRAINRRLRSIREDVETAMENAALIEVEINTKIRERLIEAKVPSSIVVNYDAEVKKGYEFWPFEGEFWRDEVGSYAFATSSVCGEQNL